MEKNEDAFSIDGRFVYPKRYFLQIVKEALYSCNRSDKSFLWVEAPFKVSNFNDFGLLPLFSGDYAGIFGQGDGCLWSLYRGKDLQFLESIKDRIMTLAKEVELMKGMGAKESRFNFNYKVYFYSGKPQHLAYEDNRFIKNWNKEIDFLKIERISIEHIKENNFNRYYTEFFKRFIDIIGSVFGLIIFSLVMLICAVCVKFALFKWKEERKKQGNSTQHDCSVFFRQVRVGKNGKLFRCYKFRTMYPGADKEKDDLKKQQNEHEVNRGPTFKMDNDPRILKFGGNFLRKHSLDELPQFFNVLKGDMSLVGPRPPTPDEVRTYLSWHYIRLSVKPGLTCIWQTSGRNDLNFDEWMRLDNKYIRERSILKDFNLKIKTVEVMISGKGAS